MDCMPFYSSYDGTRLWYEIVGAGQPLICLGGGPGGDGRELEDLGGLTRNRTLVLLDGRAIGRSATPADRDTCTFTARSRDVAELRRHLGLDRIDVLAHSSGALTAQEYAVRHSGQLGKLVLVAPAGRVEPPGRGPR